MGQGGPTYGLAEVQALVRAGARRITIAARNRAFYEGYTLEQVYKTVLALEPGQFDKTMPAKNAPEVGLFQDVYHFDDGITELYVKVQIANEAGQKVARVVSFKPWGAPGA